MRKNTRLTTAGRDPKANFGIVNPPVYHASTVLYATMKDRQERSAKPFESVTYGLSGTPTTFAFEAAVAELEGGDRCVAVPSGLAAITVPMLALVDAGDHVLVTDNCYEPARKFCENQLRRFGVETTYFDPMMGAEIDDLMRPETKVILLESPGSVTFEVQDVPTLAAAAHARDVVVMLDNTWGAGVYFSAFEHGVDISIQAATKYIGGHSDLIMGTVTTTEALWPRIKATSVGFGYHAAPDDCFLAMRGIRTIRPRMAHHGKSALAVAHWLEQRPEVKLVMHPALPSFPTHDLWKRDFTGACGLFGFVLEDRYDRKAVARMVDHLDLFGMGASWGGFESLVLVHEPADIRTATAWPHAGPSIRLHIGLEDVEDLIADLEKGFERLRAAP